MNRTSITNTRGANNRWLLRPNTGQGKQYNLFCFPFAGGGTSNYFRWPHLLPKDVEVFGVRLPGRENRIVEKPFTRLEMLVPELATVLMPFFDRPFAFFGHSMGALIAYELACYLRAKSLAGPEYLFVAAGRAPHLLNLEPAYYDLPKPEFLEKLKRYRGMPKEILGNSDLLEFILPSLRADMEMIQTYSCRESSPLPCPLTAFGGTTDIMVIEDHLSGWQRYTQGPFSLKMFETGHFFSEQAERQMLQILTTQFLGMEVL